VLFETSTTSRPSYDIAYRIIALRRGAVVASLFLTSADRSRLFLACSSLAVEYKQNSFIAEGVTIILYKNAFLRRYTVCLKSSRTKFNNNIDLLRHTNLFVLTYTFLFKRSSGELILWNCLKLTALYHKLFADRWNVVKKVTFNLQLWK